MRRIGNRPTIPLEKIITNKIALDYIKNYEKVANFFPSHFSEKKFRRTRVNRSELIERLIKYNRDMQAPSKVIENIESLSSEKSYTILTGQQPGIFSGPLYTIYKAISTIILCNKLSNNENSFIPVFWNHSEDHDVTEIDHIYIMKSNIPFKIQYYADEGKSASDIELDQKQIERIIMEIKEATPDSEFKESIIKDLLAISQKSKDIGEFFSKMMLYMFGEYGLVMIEPKCLRELMTPIFRKIIENSTKYSIIVNTAGQRLKARGYPPQIHKKIDLCNFFLTYGKVRMNVRYNGKFHVDGHIYSKKELLDLLEQNPERFSANVVTRPIIQDFLFPTYAYVAGPSEIAYFAQLKEIYDEFSLEMPIIYPRFGATIIEKKVLKVLEKYHLNVLDLKFPERLITKLLRKEVKPIFDNFIRKVQNEFSNVKDNLLKIDPNLAAPCNKSLARILETIEALEKRAARSQKEKNAIVYSQILKASNCLFPLNLPQERVLNVVEFLIKYGDSFLETVFSHFEGNNFGAHFIIKLVE